MRYQTPAMTCCLMLATMGIQLLAAQTDTSASQLPPGSLAGLRADLAARVPQLTRPQIHRLVTEGRVVGPNPVGDDGSVVVRLAPAFLDPIRSDITALEPTFAVEILFLVAGHAGAVAVDERLITVLQSISTMEGIEYYSATRSRMRMLFHESYVIGGPEDRSRRPDPVATSLPENEVLYVYQRDSSFGRNVFELTYNVDAEAVRLRMRNLTRIFYQRVVPAVGPAELEIDIVVVPIPGHLLFYGVAAARPSALLGFEQRIQRSLSNRIEALHRWFVVEMQ